MVNHSIRLHSRWFSPNRKPGSVMPKAWRAWMIWAVTSAFVLFQFFLQLSSGEMLSGLTHSYRISVVSAGVLTSSYYYMYALLQAPAGLLVDIYGPRRLLSLGALVVAMGCLLFSYTPVFGLAVVGRLMMGAGAAFAFVGCLYVIAKWFPKNRFGLMVSLAETLGMLGTLVGGVAMAYVIAHNGWRACMFYCSIVGLVLVVLLWVVVRDTVQRPRCTSATTALSFPTFLSDVKKILKKPSAWVNAGYSGCLFGILTVFVSMWSVPFFETVSHLSLVRSTSVADMAFLGVAVGCPLVSWLDVKLRYRRLLLVGAPLISTSLLLIILFCAHCSVSILMMTMFFLGLFCSSYVLTFVIAKEIATPNTTGVSVGFVNMFSVGFAPILQPLVGWLLQIGSRHGKAIGTLNFSSVDYQHALLLIPAMTLVAAVLGFFLSSSDAADASS